MDGHVKIFGFLPEEDFPEKRYEMESSIQRIADEHGLAIGPVQWEGPAAHHMQRSWAGVATQPGPGKFTKLYETKVGFDPINHAVDLPTTGIPQYAVICDGRDGERVVVLMDSFSGGFVPHDGPNTTTCPRCGQQHETLCVELSQWDTPNGDTNE